MKDIPNFYFKVLTNALKIFHRQLLCLYLPCLLDLRIANLKNDLYKSKLPTDLRKIKLFDTDVKRIQVFVDGKSKSLCKNIFF